MSERVQETGVSPAVDDDSAWWWSSLAVGEVLMLPRCTTCGRLSFPPMAACPHCGGTGFAHEQASGRGRIYSWVVVHMPQHPAFDAEAPYTILAVDLDQGPRVFGRLRGTGEVAAGVQVRAAPFDRDGVTLLGFELESR